MKQAALCWRFEFRQGAAFFCGGCAQPTDNSGPGINPTDRGGSADTVQPQAVTAPERCVQSVSGRRVKLLYGIAALIQV